MKVVEDDSVYNDIFKKYGTKFWNLRDMYRKITDNR